MGTRGFRVIRFRGRYYRFYNGHDSYPEIFGKWIVSKIPTDPEAYQKWLAKQRMEALGWHLAVERYLCRKRADYEGNEGADEDARESDDRESTTEEEDGHHWNVAEHLPTFTPLFNDLHIEWVYTIDLDHEVFTVDNGAHLHLDRIPRDAWIDALDIAYGDRVLVPNIIPEEAVADLVVRLPSPTLDVPKNLDFSIVEAKELDVFPSMQRHGPLFRARLFHQFQDTYQPILSTILLSWRSNELPFREIAYALLCVASGSPNLSLVPVEQLSPKIGYTDLTNTNRKRENAEFLAHLGVGCHLEGLPPGSSPDSEMYWLDGALVCLAGQMRYCPEALHGALARVVEYCGSERPNQCVNAILMSIQDIVLMRIYPGGRVERTKLLPLFAIPTHTSMKASERYEADLLKNLQVRTEKAIKRQEAKKRRRQRLTQQSMDESAQVEELPIEQLNPDNEDDEENEEDGGSSEDERRTCWEWRHLRPQAIKDDGTEAAFLALTYFLEVSSRQQMPPSKPKEGVFPTEIYGMILVHLEDLQTQHACMQVSRSFHYLCQQTCVMMDGVVVQAVTTSPADAGAPTLRIKTLSTGQSQDVILKKIPLRRSGRGGAYGPEKPRKVGWQVVFGSERNRRSILPDFVVGFGSIGEQPNPLEVRRGGFSENEIAFCRRPI